MTTTESINALDLDQLRAEVDRRETRAANIEAAASAAGTVARINESRRRYQDDIDKAVADMQAAEASLAQLVDDRASIAELHANFLACKLADARRYTISSRASSDMNTTEPLPDNPTSAPQSRTAIARDWRGTDFHGWLLAIEEAWAAEEIGAVDAEMLHAMNAIVTKAEDKARTAAEKQPDGKFDVEIPQTFGEKYDAALAELDHTPTVADRRAAQQKLLLQESGGRRPTWM